MNSIEYTMREWTHDIIVTAHDTNEFINHIKRPLNVDLENWVFEGILLPDITIDNTSPETNTFTIFISTEDKGDYIFLSLYSNPLVLAVTGISYNHQSREQVFFNNGVFS